MNFSGLFLRRAISCLSLQAGVESCYCQEQHLLQHAPWILHAKRGASPQRWEDYTFVQPRSFFTGHPTKQEWESEPLSGGVLQIPLSWPFLYVHVATEPGQQRNSNCSTQLLMQLTATHPAPKQHSARKLTWNQGAEVTPSIIHLRKAAHSEKGHPVASLFASPPHFTL